MTFVDALVEAILTIYALVVFSPIFLLMSLYLSEMHPAFGCFALAGAFVLGATRRSLWMALILPFGATALNLALLLSRWVSAGLWDTGLSVACHLLAVFGVICGGGWVLGRGVSWLVRTAIRCASWLVRRTIPLNHNHPFRGGATP
jgi:hypothetical protein